ncbi:GRAM domain-containing protein 2A-like [Synchiropus picturatus]
MSLNSRRYSLDSNIDERCCHWRGKPRKKTRTSLDEGRLDPQELNDTLTPLREQTIAEESLDRLDGAIRATSFVKHNKTFHKIFPETPEEEKLTHTFTCALQKEVLYQGKLFISENYVCFYSSVLLKDTKVVINASDIQEVKKHNSALFMLTLQTTDGEKYSFASLRNRDMCYRLLHSLCSNTQESSASSSPRLFSTEIKLEHDGLPTGASTDDAEDLIRQSSFSLDEGLPPLLLAREDHSRFSGPVSSGDNRRAVSWIWRIIKTPFFFLRSNVFFTICLLLTVLLLLSSGYISMRIIALEKQLHILGVLTELSLAQGDDKAT